MLSSGRLCCVWVLLVVAAAVELYDEVPAPDSEMAYQDINDIDTGPQGPGFQDEEVRLKDLLLFKLIGAQLPHQIRDMETRPHDDQELELHGVSKSKRFLSKSNLPLPRPQQRWKTKKGKAMGSQMVCYFKLCAFRNPA